MQLIVVSDTNCFEGEAKIINQLFDEGLLCFHLRKPNSSQKEIADLLQEINPEYTDRVAIHQYHDMAEEFGIIRLHYKEQDRLAVKNVTLAEQKDNGYTLSTSIHEWTEPDKVWDYILYGPVFDSISKPGYNRNVDTPIAVSENVKVVAIGGIDRNNIYQLPKMNFHGGAVLGSIWNNRDNAVDEFKILQEQCNRVLTY